MENKENKPVYDPDRYKYAAAGANFLQAKDVGSAKKCLEKLASDWNLTEDQKAGLVWNAFADDPQTNELGITKGIGIYAQKYQAEMGKMSINQMFERYSPEFNKYLGAEEKEKAKSVFDKLGKETYGSIVEKFTELNDLLNSKSKKANAIKEKAQKEFDEKYGDVYYTIQDFENLRMSKIMAPMQEESVYSNTKERFKPKEKEKKE
ncbi:hypothetical protein M0R19_01850 [Candidatus Pacearchaeota archaeon]|nr:hypothetical protein [Candidatus Pacearchaeota archaeon]